MDITSLSSLLGSLKAATEIAKFFRDSDLSLEKAEAKMKLADLISSLADAKVEASQVQQDLHEKDQEIARLRERIQLKESLAWEQPYYWKEAEGRREGPFCQHCYDGDGKVVRLLGGGNGIWQCSVCKNRYADKNYVAAHPTDYSVPRNDPFSRF